MSDVNTNIPGTTVVVNPGPPNAMAVYDQVENAGIQTQLKLEVSTGDMVGIAVAEAETQIRRKVSELTKMAGLEQKALDELLSDQNEQLKSWVEGQAAEDARLPSLKAAAEAYLGKPPTVVYGVASYSERSGNFSGRLTVSGDNFNFAWDYEKNAGTAYQDLLKQITQQGKKVEQIKRDVMTARAALNNVDALERQAKASIASQMLSRNDVGKGLVDAVRSTINVGNLIDHLSV